MAVKWTRPRPPLPPPPEPPVKPPEPPSPVTAQRLVDAALRAHVAEADPHPQYAMGPDAGGHAATHQHGGADEVATATPAANAIPKAGAGGTLAVGWIPNLSAIYDVVGTAAAAVAAHEALATDIHPQYQKESEKGVANGYAPLDANELVYAEGSRFIPLAAAPPDAYSLWVDDGTELELGTLRWAGKVSFDDALQIGAIGNEQNKIKVGGVSRAGKLEISTFGGTDPEQIILHRHSTTLHSCVLFARNNAEGASHAVVTNGQILGQLAWAGNSGDAGRGYELAAQIHAEISGTPGASDMPGALVFSTTKDGEFTPTEAVRILPTQIVQFSAGATFPDPTSAQNPATKTWTESAIAAHAGAADPHTGYQKESEKSAASGYASLDAGTKVPTAELGGAGADATKFLRGDQSWATPTAADADAIHDNVAGEIAAVLEKTVIVGADLVLIEDSEAANAKKRSTVDNLFDPHVAAADPHTQYQKESEKGAASGYASLDAGTKIPTAELGGAGATSAKFLRGDQSWQNLAGADTDAIHDNVAGEIAAVTQKTTYFASDVFLIEDSEGEAGNAKKRVQMSLFYQRGQGTSISCGECFTSLRLDSASAAIGAITTVQTVTGVGAGTYRFSWMLIWQSTSSSVGIDVQMNHTGTVSSFLAEHRFASTGTAATTAAATDSATGATGATYEAQGVRALNTNIGAGSVSSDTINSDMMSIIEGYVIVTASGDLQFRLASETGGGSNITARPGSTVFLWKT